MKTFKLKYYEVYSEIYTVEAETEEEAKENLKYMLMEGQRSGPNNCIDSGFNDVWEDVN